MEGALLSQIPLWATGARVHMEALSHLRGQGAEVFGTSSHQFWSQAAPGVVNFQNSLLEPCSGKAASHRSSRYLREDNAKSHAT